MNADNNILEVIQKRLEMMGMSQAQFAELVSATPAQMSIFLHGNGSLSMGSLNKCLDMVGVNLSLYSERMKFAKEVADYLLSKNVSSIDNWTKKDLATFTQKESLLLLFDVQSQEEYIKLEESGIIDIESTFPYFKALVSYYLSLNAVKPTASQAEQALLKLQNTTPNNDKDSLKQNEKVGSFANMALGVILPIAGILATAYSTKVESRQNGESKQFGALSLFAKSIMPEMFSLFAKAMEYIYKR